MHNTSAVTIKKQTTFRLNENLIRRLIRLKYGLKDNLTLADDGSRSIFDRITDEQSLSNEDRACLREELAKPILLSF